MIERYRRKSCGAQPEEVGSWAPLDMRKRHQEGTVFTPARCIDNDIIRQATAS